MKAAVEKRSCISGSTAAQQRRQHGSATTARLREDGALAVGRPARQVVIHTHTRPLAVLAQPELVTAKRCVRALTLALAPRLCEEVRGDRCDDRRDLVVILL